MSHLFFWGGEVGYTCNMWDATSGYLERSVLYFPCLHLESDILYL